MLIILLSLYAIGGVFTLGYHQADMKGLWEHCETFGQASILVLASALLIALWPFFLGDRIRRR